MRMPVADLDLTTICTQMWRVTSFPFEWEWNLKTRRNYRVGLKSVAEHIEGQTDEEIAGRLVRTLAQLVEEKIPIGTNKIYLVPSQENIYPLGTWRYHNLKVGRFQRAVETAFRAWKYHTWRVDSGEIDTGAVLGVDIYLDKGTKPFVKDDLLCRLGGLRRKDLYRYDE